MDIERIKQLKASIQGVIDRELREEDQEHWKSHHIADHIFHKLYDAGERIDDRKEEIRVHITEIDWKKLNFDLLISSTYSTMRSMIVRWIKALGMVDDNRKRINITDVNELATYITMDAYYDRRNLITIWLKRFGIPVYGRRQKGNKEELKAMKVILKDIWNKEKDVKLMDRYSR